MSVMQDRAQKQEYEEKGDEIYYSRILPTLDYTEMKGKIVAIDIDTGDYTIADTTMEASLRLRQKQTAPRRIWLVRVGYSYVRTLIGIDRDKLV